MEARLRVAEARLIEFGRRGASRWRLRPVGPEVRTASFASARLLGTIEGHGYRTRWCGGECGRGWVEFQ